MFYLEVVQSVLLFGAETWVLLVVMSKNLEGVPVGFLRQVTGKTAKPQRDWTWRIEAAKSVPKESGTQTLGVHIDKRHAAVADWGC